MNTEKEGKSQMTLDQYWQCVKQAIRDHPEWRTGQAAFNVLWEHRRDLSEQIRGTDLDPFHKREISAEFRDAQTMCKRGKLDAGSRYVLRAVAGGWRVWRVSEPEPALEISQSENEWLDSALVMMTKESEAA